MYSYFELKSYLINNFKDPLNKYDPSKFWDEVKGEVVQSSNFEVKDGEEQKGSVYINERQVNLNIWNIDLSFDEIKSKVEDFIAGLEEIPVEE